MAKTKTFLKYHRNKISIALLVLTVLSFAISLIEFWWLIFASMGFFITYCFVDPTHKRQVVSEETLIKYKQQMSITEEEE